MAKKGIKEVPSWFDIRNYKGAKDLTLDEIRFNLNVRVHLIDHALPYNVFGKSCSFWDDECKIIFNEIKKGCVFFQENSLPNGFVSDFSNNYTEEKGELDISTGHPPWGEAPLWGYSSNEIIIHCASLIANGLIKESDLSKNNLIHLLPANTSISMRERSFYLDGKSCFPTRNDSLALGVNLGEFTDIEIIEKFSEMLPKWREELNTPEPKSVKLMTIKDFGKVAGCEVFPQLDLMIWERLENKKIARKTFWDAIFPNRIKDVKDLEATEAKLAMMLISYDHRFLKSRFTKNKLLNSRYGGMI